MKRAGMYCVLCCSALSLISGMVLLTFAERTPFQGDESSWISHGFYCSALLARGDFTWDRWQGKERTTDSYRTYPHQYIHFPLPKLLTGIPLRMAGQKEFIRFYDWAIPEEENRAQGRIPPGDLLRAARVTPACFGVLCCITLFLVAYRCTNLCTGLIAWGLLVSNTLFITMTTRAVHDAYYNFFLLCVFLGSTALATVARGPRLIAMGALAGVAGGLACSVRITGLPLATATVVGVLVYRHAVTRGTRRDVMLPVAAFLCVALLAVVALNPFLWPSFDGASPGALARELQSLSRDIVAREVDAASIPTRYPRLAGLARPLYLFVVPLRWNTLMQWQVRHMGSGWGSDRMKYRVFHRTLFIDLATFPGEWMLLAVGLVCCANRVRISLREGAVSLRAVPLIYFLCHYLFILASMKLNWSRYYLPTVIAGRVIAAIGIYTTLSLLILWGRAIASGIHTPR